MGCKPLQTLPRFRQLERSLYLPNWLHGKQARQRISRRISKLSNKVTNRPEAAPPATIPPEMYTEQLKQQAAILAKHPKLRQNGIILFRFADKYACIGEFKQRAIQLVGRAEFAAEEIEDVLRKFSAAGLITPIFESEFGND